ncbi:class I SAM-dependent methyltransferase [Clostridium estertheticum]|uniref:class I SAM-dependent methyltransferase n=1 Tax=Clostridium estertheticum TaxID=238834 RepID=UPI0013E903F0|nr:class I SAM-dependent methyltransferase [Clostridium estertheticum]MBZ9687371.1 class I SAM-dependent methyltransferase [Clostridium estertheticum]
MQYFDLIKRGDLLDLGIGEGRNALPFAFSGFNIDGVDISDTAIERCKENLNKKDSIVNLSSSDLREYHIKKDKYTLIIVANVLNFFKNSEMEMLIKKIKDGLKEDGIVYLNVFSTLAPQYNSIKMNKKQVEENTFYIEERNSYKHFFTQEEQNKYFSDFELICCCEGLEYDHSHGNPHYHGGIKFMARKKNGV